MTKKVASTTFRLVYNLFWYFKKSNSFFPLKFRGMVRMCKKKLKLNNIICLKFSFVSVYIFIIIYIFFRNLKPLTVIKFIDRLKLKKNENFELRSFISYPNFYKLAFFKLDKYKKAFLRISKYR